MRFLCHEVLTDLPRVLRTIRAHLNRPLSKPLLLGRSHPEATTAGSARIVPAHSLLRMHAGRTLLLCRVSRPSQET